MHWPQITLIVISLFSLGMIAEKHGEPRDPYNFGTALIASALEFWLLYCGGFFN